MQQDLLSQNDEQLMTSVRDENCLQSFESLVNRWQGSIRSLCYRMTFRWDDAEDITQDVFVRLFQSRTRYKTTAKFKTYLWSIAINRCRDFHRSTKRRDEKMRELVELRVHDSVTHADNKDEIENVQIALEKLDPLYREVLILRHYEELRFSDIANVLDIPVGTVASRMAKAIKLVGEILSADNDTKRDVG